MQQSQNLYYMINCCLQCFVFASVYNFCFVCSTQSISNAKVEIKVDTIILKKIPFESDLKSKMGNCNIEFGRIDKFTKIGVKNEINLLNKELKTKDFSSLEVVVGVSLQLIDNRELITLMEWHFSSVKKAEKIEKAMNKLKKGQIWHTIVPIGYKWVRVQKKLYVMQFTPRSDHNPVANSIFECIRSKAGSK